MERKELLIVTYVIFALSLVFVSVIFPFIYKFGVEKSRIISIAVVAVPTMLGYVLYEMGLQLPIKNQLFFVLRISPLILFLIIFCSASLSYRIYKNKDI